MKLFAIYLIVVQALCNMIFVVFPNPYILPVQAFVRNFGDNRPCGMIALNPRVFATPIRPALVHQVRVWHLACRRSGTASSKSKAEKRGSGRKLRKQTGIGMARRGQLRVPQARGGGSVFGPKPKDWSYNLQPGTLKLALRSSLSAKYKDNELVVVADESLKSESGTKNELMNIINQNGWKKVVIVDSKLPDAQLAKSLSKCKDKEVKHFIVDNKLNAFHITNGVHCILTVRGLRKLESLLMRSDEEDPFSRVRR